MSIPQRSRLTNNQKLTLIEESQQPGFKIEDATIMQMRLAIALEHYQIKVHWQICTFRKAIQLLTYAVNKNSWFL